MVGVPQLLAKLLYGSGGRALESTSPYYRKTS
jgi:hypothetical protein